MEPFEDDSFVAALESLRPAPRPAFAAELDERAAAGFPRRSPLGDSWLGRLVARVRAVEPRRALVPAGATALAAVVAITVVVAVSDNQGGSPSAMHLNSSMESTQYEAPAPRLSQLPKEAASSANASAATEQLRPFAHSPNPGRYATQAPHREIERSAEMVLGTDPADLRKASSEVFETVHTYRGIVLRSSIRDASEGEARARFELLIPTAKLSDALAGFSAIAEVRSRHEATADITAPTVRTGERLRDSQAKIEGLLVQLSRADNEAERTATEAQLRAERRHAAYLRSQLSNLKRRTNLSRVALRIETGAPSTTSNGTGGWSIGDALDDAGHILAIAAGVTIVGLAIIAPVALIALLAWLANRARIRRARERALA